MSIKLIDSHSHPQDQQYDNDREEMIKRALDGGVQMICVGTDLKISKKAVDLAEKYDGIWAAVGLHPNDNLEEQFDPQPYKKLCENEKVVAIGEIGLDYYRTTESELQTLQKERFKKQLAMATELDKPVIIHCRDPLRRAEGEASAHDDMLEILNGQSLRGVIHSFTGTWEQAKRYFDSGFYIGLNGIITFTDQYNQMVINAPLDRILLETDAPYLAPIPYRGKRNESLYVVEVAKKISELRKITVEEVAEKTSKNTSSLFGINL